MGLAIFKLSVFVGEISDGLGSISQNTELNKCVRCSVWGFISEKTVQKRGCRVDDVPNKGD